MNFFQLEPGNILDAVDSVVLELGMARTSGRAMALNSLENRVYDIELEDNTHVVAKFYRPGRWSLAQILEEHSFLFALRDLEIPVVCPLDIDGDSLFEEQNMYFAIFPKVKGRLVDELDSERLKILGRYIGRIHKSNFRFRHRQQLTVENWGWKPLDYLLQSDFLDPVYRARYEQIATALFQHTEPLLKAQPQLALHGDCHLGNTLWQTDSPFFLDFDDSMMGPAVQDIWMVIRGRGPEAEKDRKILLEGYETFQKFDWSTLRLLEPLRALRIIHYSAWIAKRMDDPIFPITFPHFGTPRWWEEEIQSLQEVLSLQQEAEWN